MKKLFLLDGSSLLFRAFYALPLLTGPGGEYTNAVTGFANMLLRIIKEHQPDMMAVAFDKSRQTFRTRLFPEYKGTRGATPDEFKCQVPILEEMMKAWGISFLELDDYEADDILGTLSKRAEDSGEIERLSSGNLFPKLRSNRRRILQTSKKRNKSNISRLLMMPLEL